MTVAIVGAYDPKDSPIKLSPSTERFIRLSTYCWFGEIDGKVTCIWGLISPTVLSDDAYLWLDVTEHFAGNEFLFVRHSQRVVKSMLEDYPRIIGHCAIDNPKAIRWVKWLGGRFGEPEGFRLPFTIRRA